LPQQYREETANRTPQNGIYNYRWHKARDRYLIEHPLCVECLNNNRVVAAEEVDHIQPHRGDYKLFWDESNWQSLCVSHHSQKTAKEGAFGNESCSNVV
jgi:5-methylcytosine-specific restriction protein A